MRFTHRSPVYTTDTRKAEGSGIKKSSQLLCVTSLQTCSRKGSCPQAGLGSDLKVSDVYGSFSPKPLLFQGISPTFQSNHLFFWFLSVAFRLFEPSLASSQTLSRFADIFVVVGFFFVSGLISLSPATVEKKRDTKLRWLSAKNHLVISVYVLKVFIIYS